MRSKLFLGIILILAAATWKSGLLKYLNGTIQNSGSTKTQSFAAYEYLRPLHAPVRATFIVAHGLNLLPSRMNELCDFLQGSEFEVYRLALSGHRGNFDELKTVTRAQWLVDFKTVYEIAKAKAPVHPTPIYFLGFSMGGLLGVDAAASDSQIHFDKMILFAPAFATHVPSWLTKFVQMLFPQFIIPSSAPRDYRVYDHVPLKAYGALFDSIAALKTSDLLNVDVPTQVFIHPKDHLVSEKGLKRLVEEKHLTHWSFDTVSVEDTGRVPQTYHLIIDKVSLGVSEWSRVTEKILTFLRMDVL